MRPTIKFEKEQYAQIAKLSEMGCTDEEMAAVMGVSLSTWKRMKSRDEQLVKTISEGKANLSVKLRRMQIEMAMSGDRALLIHLGKYLLGQSDKVVLEEKRESPLTQFLPRAETIKNLPKGENEKS